MNRAARRKADQELARERRRAERARHTAGKILEEQAHDPSWWREQLVRHPKMRQIEFEWFCATIAHLQGGPAVTFAQPAARPDVDFREVGSFMDAQIGPVLRGMPNPVREIRVEVDEAEMLRQNWLDFGAAETRKFMDTYAPRRRPRDVGLVRAAADAREEVADSRDWIPPMPNEEDE